MRVGLRLYQHVHIAVGPEVFTKHRTEYAKLRDAPAAAKRRDRFRIDIEIG